LEDEASEAVVCLGAVGSAVGLGVALPFALGAESTGFVDEVAGGV